MLNLDSLPLNGRLVMTGIAYALFTYSVSAPTIAERAIAKSNWGQQCKLRLLDELDAQQTPQRLIPKTDCNSTLGAIMPELRELCNALGNPDPQAFANNHLREQERRRQEIEAKRLALAVSQIDSQCDCAATVVTQDSSWLLYAGSWRWVTPPEITNLHSTLSRAVQSPSCAGGAL